MSVFKEDWEQRERERDKIKSTNNAKEKMTWSLICILLACFHLHNGLFSPVSTLTHFNRFYSIVTQLHSPKPRTLTFKLLAICTRIMASKTKKINSNTHFYNKLSRTKNYISKKKRNCHYK